MKGIHLKPIANLILFWVWAMMHPFPVAIFLGTALDHPFHFAAIATVLAYINSKMIWAIVLRCRDLDALSELCRLLSRSGKVERFSFSDYFPGASFHTCDILVIERYKNYRAVQYDNYSSFAVVPTPPIQPNSTQLFYLLHECSHIGPDNRRWGLNVITSAKFSIMSFSPAAILFAHGDPLITIVLAASGGFCASLPFAAGRLLAEMEADYRAFKLTQIWPLSESIDINSPGIRPPKDRKLGLRYNEIRSASFQKMLDAARLHDPSSIKLDHPIIYELMFTLSLPLLMFIIILAICHNLNNPFDIALVIKSLLLWLPMNILLWLLIYNRWASKLFEVNESLGVPCWEVYRKEQSRKKGVLLEVHVGKISE